MQDNKKCFKVPLGPTRFSRWNANSFFQKLWYDDLARFPKWQSIWNVPLKCEKAGLQKYALDFLGSIRFFGSVVLDARWMDSDKNAYNWQPQKRIGSLEMQRKLLTFSIILQIPWISWLPRSNAKIFAIFDHPRSQGTPQLFYDIYESTKRTPMA